MTNTKPKSDLGEVSLLSLFDEAVAKRLTGEALRGEGAT